jgi:AcrB/AcrD/AcrF family
MKPEKQVPRYLRDFAGDRGGDGRLSGGDGARLRLWPKVLTVATMVASLLPIMWSHRQGAEITKPLATPVIGGMLSSRLHILIVTPVIFLGLRGRELQKGTLHDSLVGEKINPSRDP